MIFDARSSLRRWITVTLSAKRVRKIASSKAESPPPTTTISCSRKKNPSHVAQVDTPWPRSRASPGTPSMSALAPVATISDLGQDVGLAVGGPGPHAEGAIGQIDLGGLAGDELCPEARRLVPEAAHEIGSEDAVDEAGVVLDLGGEHQLAAGLVARGGRLALDDEGPQVGPGGVDGGGEAGGAGAEDHHLTVSRPPQSLWRPGPRRAPGGPAATRTPPTRASDAHTRRPKA